MSKKSADVRDVAVQKPYTSPRIVVYGDVREVTRAFPAGHGMNETGTTGADKTGP